ncbi:MAG: glycosyltransferase family 39 protein [Gammaproteobacteria bacterium]|nr:glycosyltransferase family 39 protein [Gammaproteobacteria bacterium]
MRNFTLKFNTYYRLGWLEYVILFVVLFLSFYLGMSTYGIENVNEGLYAEIPREMLQLGNYVIPKLNFLPYIEKPPLFYWLIALSYKIFGISTWSARVVPATSAALICLSLVYFGHVLRRNREGWLAAIILATSIGFVATARVLILDMALTLFFTLALFSFYSWYKSNRVGYLRIFYVFFALAFLTKGMLALLIPLIGMLFLLSMQVSSKKMLACLDVVGISLLGAIIIPWHYLAMHQQAGFIWDYFVNEQVFRFLGERTPNDYHTGPIYFYIPNILLYLFPWSLLSFLLLKPDKHLEKSLYRFLWVWFTLPLIFFSLAKAKGDYYMVVATPALALLLSFKINEIFTTKNKTFIYFFAFLGFFEITVFGLLYSATVQNKIGVYLPDLWRLDLFLAHSLYILFVSATIVTFAGLLLCIKYNKKPLLHFLAIICLIFFIVAFYVINKQKIGYRLSEKSLANFISQHDPNRPTYLYQDYEKISSIVFYLQKRLPLIDSQSKDLEYGMRKLSSEDWFFSLNNFLNTKDKETHYVIARKDRLMEFLHAVTPHEYCILAQSGSSVLLSNKLEECEAQ